MAELWYKDGATLWRKAKELWYDDAGVWRKTKELWYNDGGVWRKVFSGFALSTGHAWQTDGLRPAAAVVTFNSDGTVSDSSGGPANWGLPTSAGAGSGFWVKFTQTVGANAATVGSTGTWLSLAAGQSIGYAAINANRAGAWQVDMNTAASDTGAVTVGTATCNIAPA